MRLSTVRLLAIGCSLGCLALTLACGSSSSPAAPSKAAATPPPAAPTLAAPTINAPISGEQLNTLKPTLVVNDAAATGTAGTVTYEFELSETDAFPPGSTTSNSGTNIAEATGTTGWTPPSNLRPNFLYSWHARARAVNVSNPTDWSLVATFKTDNSGFVSGQTIFDPLTNGKTVGSQVGGHFVPGGWMADSLTDSIDYTIAPCVACRIEFDVTGTLSGLVYAQYQADLKWLSMADPGAINGGFVAFRNSPWKMNLEVRGDGDGSGLQLIWRNGATDDDTGGDPNYGDHTGKFNTGGPISGDPNHKYHVVVAWTATNYVITVDGQQQFPGRGGDTGVFKAGHTYTPSPTAIELGCRARAESMIGAIWSNFNITTQ